MEQYSAPYDSPAPIPAGHGGAPTAVASAGSRRSAIRSIMAVAIAFALAASVTWRRLGSLLIDCGRELEVPRRILEGDVLYRDVRYYWGPLAPYLNAALYGLFGVHADVLMWAGIATAALACAGLYLLARHVLDQVASAAAAIAFVFLCAFSQRIQLAIFNFVMPFNCSATYGMTAAIWSVHLLLRQAETGRSAPLFASAVLAGLAALTKVEIVLALAMAHGAFLVGAGWRPWKRYLLAYAIGAAFMATGLIVASQMSQGKIWPSLRALVNPASRYYIADTMGLLSVYPSLGDAVLSALGLGLVAAVAALAGRRSGRLGRGSAIAAVAAVGIAFVVPSVLLPSNFLRAMPLAMIVALGALLVARIRRAPAPFGGTATAQLVVWAFGLGSLGRIVFRVGPDHYGFFLIPATLVCLALMFCVYLRDAVGGGPRARRVVEACGVSLLVGAAASGLRASLPQYQASSAELVSPRAHMRVDPEGPEMTVVPLLARWPASTRASAVPEGAGFIFAAGLQTGLDGMTSYLPMEIPDDAADAQLVATWERAPPQVVIYTGIGAEFGYAGFGADYGRRAYEWLSAKYRVVAQPSEQFLILVPQ